VDNGQKLQEKKSIFKVKDGGGLLWSKLSAKIPYWKNNVLIRQRMRKKKRILQRTGVVSSLKEVESFGS